MRAVAVSLSNEPVKLASRKVKIVMRIRPPAIPRTRAEPAADGAAERSEAFARLRDEVRRLRVLAEVADTVTQRLSLDHQLPRLIDLMVEAFDADRAALFLYDPDSG